MGETETERDAGDTERKLRQQVRDDLAAVPDERLADVTIAYEPIWAIGTGRVATPEQAQEAIAFIRALVGDRDAGAAERVRILYGGSVKPENAAELLALPDVDGALVGGASLDAESFAAIVRLGRDDATPSPYPVLPGGARRLGSGRARPRQRRLARAHTRVRRAVARLPAHAPCWRAVARSACRMGRWATARSAT